MILAGILCAAAGSILHPFLAGRQEPCTVLMMQICVCFLRMLCGLCLPLLITGILFRLRMIGAGDIKMLCMAGAFLGPARAVRCILASLMAGAVVSLYLMVIRKNAWKRLFAFWDYVKETAERGKIIPYLDRVSDDGKFCFSLPILAGILFTGGYFIV